MRLKFLRTTVQEHRTLGIITVFNCFCNHFLGCLFITNTFILDQNYAPPTEESGNKISGS